MKKVLLATAMIAASVSATAKADICDEIYDFSHVAMELRQQNTHGKEALTRVAISESEGNKEVEGILSEIISFAYMYPVKYSKSGKEEEANTFARLMFTTCLSSME